MLVAREYLRLADPRAIGDVGLSETKSAFTRGRLSAGDWSQVVKGAHLASAAIRLACIDDVLEQANTGRALYGECRAYFGSQKRFQPAADRRGCTCSVSFHIMLRDSVGHREPPPGEVRYEARQRCIEATPFSDAHARLRQTEQELAGVLSANGVVLPAVEG